MEHLKYPNGKFEFGKRYTTAETLNHIAAIEQFPSELNELSLKLNMQHLESSYRPQGWTARQIIHHLADSHLNAYIRTKLTLAEDKPTVKPYDQDDWANHEDAKNAPVEMSLMLIQAVHQRWVYLLKSLSPADYQRTYYHPEYTREFQLDELLALYAWHGKQHNEHLKIIISN